MEQRDYLKREIDQLGRVLGKIAATLLGLKKGDASMQGIEIVSQALKNEIDLDLDGLLSIETEDLIIFLVVVKGFSESNLEKLVAILLMIADDMRSNDPQLNSCYQRCLVICEYLEKIQRSYSFDRHQRLDQIKARII